jgi:transposase
VSGAGSLLLHPISSGSQRAVGMDVRRTGVSCSELVTGSCWTVLVGRDCCDDLIGRVGVMTRPWIVDDDLWAVSEPLLPSWPEWSPGPKPVPDRLCLQGILYVLHLDIAWQLLPLELGFGSRTALLAAPGPLATGRGFRPVVPRPARRAERGRRTRLVPRMRGRLPRPRGRGSRDLRRPPECGHGGFMLRV